MVERTVFIFGSSLFQLRSGGGYKLGGVAGSDLLPQRNIDAVRLANLSVCHLSGRPVVHSGYVDGEDVTGQDELQPAERGESMAAATSLRLHLSAKGRSDRPRAAPPAMLAMMPRPQTGR